MAPRTPLNILLRALTLGCLCFAVTSSALAASRGVHVNLGMLAVLVCALAVVAIHTATWLRRQPV
jgi:uncharacterized membrane protein YidH (DUF202 family)